MKRTTFWILLISLLISCQNKDDKDTTPQKRTFTYTFEEDFDQWEGDFADLPVDDEDIFELAIEHAPLPEETGIDSYGIKIQGHNRSDDLFMFLKRHISGLSPSTNYRISFDLELASQYPENSVGIGGSPGGSVYLKAGATPIEPRPEIENTAGRDYWRMNIDKGNQAQEGTDMINLGTIGIEGDEFKYTLIQRNNEGHPFEARTDSNGNLWVIVGTDSGFEGLTVLYYNAISVTLEEIH